MGQASDVRARRLAAELRATGVGQAQIARILRDQFEGMSARKAMRFAWGWSQDQACAEWHRLFGERKAPKQFSYWENWPVSGHAPSLETLDQLYRCGVVDLLADLPDYGAEPASSHRSRPANPVATTSAWAPPSARSGAIPAALLDGSLGEPGAQRWFFTNATGGVATVLDLLFSHQELDSLADRVEAARSGRARIDDETPIGLTQVTYRYRRVYRSAGAATLLGPAYGTLRLLVDLAPDAGGDQRDMVVSMIGQVGTFIGTVLMLDLGDFAAAKPYFAIASRAGDQINSAELLAFAIGCRAFQATYSGQLADGVAFADGALDVAARGIAPRTHGWLAAVASEMHASQHEELACERLLAEAADHLDQTADEEEWLGIGAFNPDKLTAYRGGDLGRYRDAQAHLHQSLDRLDPALKKHRATACIDLVDAYVRDGRIDDGAHHAIAALDIVTGTRHADSFRRVEELHRAVAPTQTLTVRQLGAKRLEFKSAS